ncbi:MAG: hypothetical protein Q9201_004007 [Fulgogasparrea decipioides]
MLSTIIVTLFVLPITYCVYSYWCLYRNIVAAKATGLTYVVIPWNNLNILWLLSRPFLLPCLKVLPFRDSLWLALLSIDWPWLEQYTVFQRLGCDSFISVSPTKNYFHTADAAVIDQITRRRNDFPKPVEVYGSLDLYGKNVVSTEGNLWKHHRKTVSPPFNEKNNRMVWFESIRQAQAMVKGWMRGQPESSPTVMTVADDCMRLSLHIISHAGFGVKLNWPGSEEKGEQPLANGHLSKTADAVSNGPDFGPDHKMSYTDALHKYLPFQGVKRSYDSYVEWGKYLRELFDNKRNDIAAGKSQEGMDLMGFLLKGAGMTPSTLSQSPSSAENRPQSKQLLSDTEIMGNAFVFLLAGHETAANSIHFSCLYLALRPSSQRRLQASLDRIFDSRPVSEWDYEKDFNALFGGMAGAVLAEELRLIPPVAAIPKCVLPNAPPQPLKIDNKTFYIPPATYINLLSVAAHRNPKFWPSGPPSDPQTPVHPTSNTDNDLEEFKPERWLRDLSNINNGGTAEADAKTTEHTEDAPNTATGVNASTNLHRPPRGAYIPFSEGYRACLGRRFAQVEVLAVLAVIFKNYSVELSVEKYATDEEVAAMGEDRKREVWEKAGKDMLELLREKVGMIFTMQLREGKVGVRLVKRGAERFSY